MRDPRSPLKGVFLAIAAFTCFVGADTCIKAVGRHRLPAYEVVSSVAVVEMVLLTTLSAARRRLHVLWPHRPARALLRAGLDLANNLCVVIALRHLPLALFYILVFLAPAVVTVVEAVFLKEPLGRQRWLAVLTGFAGVVIAVDPFGAVKSGDRVGYLACLVCVVCFSANMVWSRHISQGETAESLTFFSSLLQAAVGVVAVLGHALPLSIGASGLLAATAAISLVGSLCFFLALSAASAATVSQYHYTQLLTGALLAFLIWGERPTRNMFVGAVLIVASGWVAARLARQQETAPLQM